MARGCPEGRAPPAPAPPECNQGATNRAPAAAARAQQTGSGRGGGAELAASAGPRGSAAAAGARGGAATVLNRGARPRRRRAPPPPPTDARPARPASTALAFRKKGYAVPHGAPSFAPLQRIAEHRTWGFSGRGRGRARPRIATSRDPRHNPPPPPAPAAPPRARPFRPSPLQDLCMGSPLSRPPGPPRPRHRPNPRAPRAPRPPGCPFMLAVPRAPPPLAGAGARQTRHHATPTLRSARRGRHPSTGGPLPPPPPARLRPRGGTNPRRAAAAAPGALPSPSPPYALTCTQRQATPPHAPRASHVAPSLFRARARARPPRAAQRAQHSTRPAPPAPPARAPAPRDRRRPRPLGSRRWPPGPAPSPTAHRAALPHSVVLAAAFLRACGSKSPRAPGHGTARRVGRGRRGGGRAVIWAGGVRRAAASGARGRRPAPRRCAQGCAPARARPFQTANFDV
jgi:hypothetical protein